LPVAHSFTPLYVLIAYLLVYAPKYLVTIALMIAKNFDNYHPRDQQLKLEGWKKRGVAAHFNGFESFTGVAAASILAYLAKVDAFWVSTLSLTYLGARALYPIAYIANYGWTRSTIWTVSLTCTLGLMFLAFRA
jgi:uncharacterized MAPEG superfamily protein